MNKSTNNFDVLDIEVTAEQAYHVLGVVYEDLFQSTNSEEMAKRFKAYYVKYSALIGAASDLIFNVKKMAEQMQEEPTGEAQHA